MICRSQRCTESLYVKRKLLDCLTSKNLVGLLRSIWLLTLPFQFDLKSLYITYEARVMNIINKEILGTEKLLLLKKFYLLKFNQQHTNLHCFSKLL